LSSLISAQLSKLTWHHVGLGSTKKTPKFFIDFLYFQNKVKTVSSKNDKTNAEKAALKAARDEFVSQWGALGSQWGINRTMAQIHALLMTVNQPLTTDDLMEELEISRGNAHSNVKELIAWGLVRTVVVRGERKEFFEAEKDVWEIARTVARERKRREIEPALGVLRDCMEKSRKMDSPEAKAFHQQMRQLEEFVSFASKVADQVSSMKHGFAVQLAAKLLG
jgi:DNA-binding transcriptional regulator GbsR (MarR family)